MTKPWGKCGANQSKCRACLPTSWIRFIHEGSKRKKKGIKQQSLINILRWTLNLNQAERQKSKNEELARRILVLMFFLLLFFQCLVLQNTVVFSTCDALKTWFELWRVELFIQMI